MVSWFLCHISLDFVLFISTTTLGWGTRRTATQSLCFPPKSLDNRDNFSTTLVSPEFFFRDILGLPKKPMISLAVFLR